MEEKTNWRSVGVYYFLACLWSWPFFWMRDMNPEYWKSLQIQGYLKTWLYMWGPGIAAIFCFLLFKKHKRTMTFRGTQLGKGITAYAIFPITLALLEKEPKFLLIGCLGFISMLGEELGWRGFLQDALKIKSDFKKAIFIGILWEVWHFTNRYARETSLLRGCIRQLAFCIVTITLSYIIIKLSKKTQSLFIAVTVHTLFNAIFEFDRAWQSALLCVPIWIWLYRSWDREIKIPFLKTKLTNS